MVYFFRQASWHKTCHQDKDGPPSQKTLDQKNILGREISSAVTFLDVRMRKLGIVILRLPQKSFKEQSLEMPKIGLSKRGNVR